MFNCFPCWGKSTFISDTHTHTVPNKTNVPVTSRPNTDTFPFSTFSHAIQRLSLLSIIIPDDNKRRKKSLYTRIFSNMKSRFHYTSPFSPSFFSIFIPSLSSYSSGLSFSTLQHLLSLSTFPLLYSLFFLLLLFPSPRPAPVTSYKTRVVHVCLYAVVARLEKITRRVLSLHNPY